MPDNLQPLPDEHIEARITAWVLGEASPFEAAELEALVAQFPEHKAHFDRIHKIHSQLHETELAESDHSWKLPPEKRAKIEAILGEDPATIPSQRESRIRIVSFRAALAIAACLVITFIVTRFIYVPKSTITSKSTIVNYSAKPEPPAFAAESSEVANESESLAMNGKRERSAAFRRRESAPRDQLAGGFDRPDDARQESPAQLEGNLLRANKELSEITQALPSIEMAGEASAMAEAIPSDESIPQVQRKPSVPSNSAAKVIASSTTSPTATPIPSEALAMNAPADFGNGWADEGTRTLVRSRRTNPKNWPS